MTSKINYDARAHGARMAKALSQIEDDFEADDPLWARIRFTLAAIALACVAVTLAWEFWPL